MTNVENHETFENSKESMAKYFVILMIICGCFYCWYCVFLSRESLEKITPKKKKRTDDILRYADRKSDFENSSPGNLTRIL